MIDRIHLQRFKRFRDQWVPMGRDGVSLVAGANNTGKSTVLHAIAVWEFCRSIIRVEKGEEAFLSGVKKQGLGLASEDFSPILVPSLGHIWTNLGPQKSAGDVDGYTLKIAAFWKDSDGVEKNLEFGMALANDRMFVKPTNSNLKEDDVIPKAAYLPPFAGITDREMRLPGAIRRRRIGEGLAGAVLRNLLLDLYLDNQRKRKDLQEHKKKISDTDLKELRRSDPWEVLQQTLRTVFNVELQVRPFREEYHSYIKIEVVKGELKGYKINRYKKYKPRDLMVEGSGFLQWLSVYALATSPDIDVLLLDEPDAHLHPSLQAKLVEKLNDISKGNNKKVLVATHSSEIIRSAPPERILKLENSKSPRFLSNEFQKVGLLSGIGSDYAPKIDQIKRTKRLLLVEGDFDFYVLKKVAEKKNLDWPNCWVDWETPDPHKERRHFYKSLAEEVPGLKAFSLRDRDNEAKNTVNDSLEDTGYDCDDENFIVKKWKRRNIESYLIVPRAIARTTGETEAEIKEKLQRAYSIVFPESFGDHRQPDTILDIDGKKVLEGLGVEKRKLVENLDADEVCDDLISVVDSIIYNSRPIE